MPGYEDVLAKEEAWYTADLAAQGVPALTAALGGPFQAVAANPRRLSQARNPLWLASAQSVRGKGSKTDARWDHDVVAVVLWTAGQGGGRAHLDQAALAAAAERVVARVAGPPGDRGHGSRWWMVGPVTVAPPSPAQLLSWGDVLGGLGAAYELTVSYRVTEVCSHDRRRRCRGAGR